MIKIVLPEAKRLLMLCAERTREKCFCACRYKKMLCCAIARSPAIHSPRDCALFYYSPGAAHVYIILGPRAAAAGRRRRVKRTRAESDAECSRITSERPLLIATTLSGNSLSAAVCAMCADSEFIMMDAIYNREYEC